jgi:hypothetical protein
MSHMDRIIADAIDLSWPMDVAELREVANEITVEDVNSGCVFQISELETFQEVEVQVAGQYLAIARPLPDGSVQVR